MKTLLASASSSASLRRAIRLLREGSLVAFPTDTVYGLGTTPFDAQSVQRLFVAKVRPPERSIPVLLAAAADIGLVAREIGPLARALAARFWPGPLTLVVPRNDRLADSVFGPTVGVRIPDHPVALELLRATGPLAVTSANLSGGASPTTAEGVLAQLGGRVQMILDGGPTAGGIPSTVVDTTGEDLVLLRRGPLSLEDLRSALA